jgi:glucose-6-phosphate isomerase
MKLNVANVDLEYDEKEKKLYSDGTEVPFSTRLVGDMKDVLFNPEFVTAKNRDAVIYRMFRGAGVEKNKTVFDAHNIRYDVTVLEDYDLGGEYTKTLGHYHPIAENGLAYPEIYEVIYGKAVYLLQKKHEDGGYEVILVEAKKGDKVIFPPNYGHISINVGNGILIEANLVNSTFESNYQSIKDMHGGAIYLLRKDNMVVNKNYKDVSVSHQEAQKAAFLDASKSLYDEYISQPKHFVFLNKPEFLLWEHDRWDIDSQHF